MTYIGSQEYDMQEFQLYNEADQVIHQWAQALAKFNRSFVPGRSDDSHTNLAFDPVGKQIFGRWARLSDRPVIWSLDLIRRHFLCVDDHRRVISSVSIPGKDQLEIEEEMASLMSTTLGIRMDDFLAPLHFDIPEYAFVRNTQGYLNSAAIEEWIRLREQANTACHQFLNHIQVEGEVRIWPHHFDTGVYVEPTPLLGLGFGWAMEDDMAGQAYFYYSAYGKNGFEVPYSDLRKLTIGYWQEEGSWKGAILPARDTNKKNIRHFILEVTHHYFKKLNK